MRIKEFLINRYGPLADSGRISLGDFTLLYGRNEEGKSLTIDAIMKMLFSKKADLRKFEHLDRVDEMPDGYVIITDDDGKQKKLPEAGDISAITDLSSSDCANLFVIRNSNLSISAEPESTFYKNVTDRLTGLRTEEISVIKKKLQDLGMLTQPASTASLSSKSGYGNIAERCEKAALLIEEIDDLRQKLDEKGFDDLEVQLSSLDEQIEDMSVQLATLEQAEKAKKYQEASEAMGKLEKAVESIRTLEGFNKDDEQKWRDAERDVGRLKGEESDIKKDIAGKEKLQREMTKEQKEEKRKLDALENRKKEIDHGLRDDLKAHEKQRQDLVSRQSIDSQLKVPAYASSGLLAVLAISLVFATMQVLIVLVVAFAVATIALWGVHINLARKNGQIESDFVKIQQEAGTLGFTIERIEDLGKQLRDFEDALDLQGRKVNDVSNDMEVLKTGIEKARNSMSKAKDGIGALETTIEQIRAESGAKSLKAYGDSLQKRREHEETRKEQLAVLRTHFPQQYESLEENVKEWKRKIRELQELAERAKGVEYDEGRVSALKEQRHEAAGVKQELAAQLESFGRDLYDIERQANGILRTGDEPLLCRTSAELEAIRNALFDFRSQTEKNRDRVVNVLKIFEEIEGEEERKVQTLFGPESAVTEYYKEITDGRYAQVDFLPEQGSIVVTDGNGKPLDASKLSGGAYDQLYLSIRLALGDRLLKGSHGFFIMDDPFIKADPRRLNKQIDMLHRICAMGWQIIFFSAKGEIRESLSDRIKSHDVKFVEIKDIRH